LRKETATVNDQGSGQEKEEVMGFLWAMAWLWYFVELVLEMK